MSLSFMLTVSLALHAAVVMGYLLTQLHPVAAPVSAASEMPSTTLMLLASEEQPHFQLPVLAKSESSEAATATALASLPSPSQPVPKSLGAPTLSTPASMAVEVNPNAHVRALPPQEILSPKPATHLDGKNGVVFLLDISGSMYEPCDGSTRLAMARDILRKRILALRDGTPFAITVYAQAARNSGPLVAATAATREAAIRFIMEDIDCGGGTNLPAGLVSAMTLEAGNVVLVSDGDLNATLTDLMDQTRSILNPKRHGPMLTVVGVAPRSNTDATSLLKSLAGLTGGAYLIEKPPEETTTLLTSAKNDPPTP